MRLLALADRGNCQFRILFCCHDTDLTRPSRIFAHSGSENKNDLFEHKCFGTGYIFTFPLQSRYQGADGPAEPG